MAIKSVSGNADQPTYYVIKGDGQAQNMAQFWSQLVSQQKYRLVQDAIKIAMTEEKARSTTELSKAKMDQQMSQRLQREISSLEKQKTNLITKEAQMQQRLDIASTPSTTTTSGGGGSAGKRNPAAQQALAETKELRRLEIAKDDLTRDKADYDRNAELFETSNPNFAQAERSKSKAAQARIDQIDKVVNGADKNNNGVIDANETGQILPSGSYEVGDGTKAKGRTSTRSKKITAEPADFSGRRKELQDMIDELDSQGRELTRREVEKNPTILARAAEIAGRTNLGTPRDTPDPMIDAADIERDMMNKYFPQEPFTLPAIDSSIEKPKFGQKPFENTINKMYGDDKARMESEMQVKEAPLMEEMGDTPAQPAMPAEQIQIPQATRVEDEPDMAPRKTLRDRAKELRERMFNMNIDVPSEVMGSGDVQTLSSQMGNGVEGIPDGVGQIPPEAMLSGTGQPQTGQVSAQGMSGIEPLDEAYQGIKNFPNTTEGVDAVLDGNNELELYNQLIGGPQAEPKKEDGAFNTTGDNKLEEAKVLQAAVASGRTKTKQEVRRQLETAEDTEWASVVTKLYSPSPTSSAQERIRLRDNAYQQLSKTYEDNPTVLANSVEFLIALDALEMGALPSE
jgi:hypothetical protein